MDENIINNEAVMDTVKQAAEAIPAKISNKYVALGVTTVVVGGGILVAGIAAGVKHYARKKKLKDEQVKAEATGVDNVAVAKDDFEEDNSVEE